MQKNEIVDKTTGEIMKFDPEQSKDKMSQASALIRYGEDTGNIEIVFGAIDALCDERFQFLQWWDVNKEKGGRGKTVRRSANSLPDKDARNRWRKKHNTAEQNEITKSAMKEKSRRIIDGTSSVQGSKEKQDEWYTPAQFIESARKVMGGIDLDPATSEYAQETVKAINYYTEDALEKEWSGRVWLNPPFTDVLKFADKLILHLVTGEVTQSIMLTNNNTDTLWWHQLATNADKICFTRGRISFYNRAGEAKGNTNGQTFFYFGKRLVKFTDEFSRYGIVMK